MSSFLQAWPWYRRLESATGSLLSLTGFRLTSLLRGCFPSLYRHSGLTSPILHRASWGGRRPPGAGIIEALLRPQDTLRLAQAALRPLSVGPVPSVPAGSLPSLPFSRGDGLSSRDAETWRLHGVQSCSLHGLLLSL